MGPPADRVVGKDSPHHAQPPSAMEPCRGASAHTSVLRGRRPLASRCRNPYLPSSLPIRTEVELASWHSRPFRSEERRVGKECVSTCRSRWSPSHSTKNTRNLCNQTK